MMIREKIDALVLALKAKVDAFFDDQRGDTTFISILVVLGIALALAGVFLIFKENF